MKQTMSWQKILKKEKIPEKMKNGRKIKYEGRAVLKDISLILREVKAYGR